MSDLIDRQMVSYKLTDLVNEFEEILSHIRESEENDCVCALCKYDADGAYIGQSGDWCNECPGFDKADCFELNDKYKKEWLECMNTLPSVKPEQKWETCFDCPLSHGCPKISGCTNGQTMEYASEIPDDCPISVQTERKKGKWTRHFDGNEWYWYCSSCKEQWYEEDLWMGGNSFPNFCPNCGCRMEEGDFE